jgi:hypothetical protein
MLTDCLFDRGVTAAFIRPTASRQMPSATFIALRILIWVREKEVLNKEKTSHGAGFCNIDCGEGGGRSSSKIPLEYLIALLPRDD